MKISKFNILVCLIIFPIVACYSYFSCERTGSRLIEAENIKEPTVRRLIEYSRPLFDSYKNLKSKRNRLLLVHGTGQDTNYNLSKKTFVMKDIFGLKTSYYWDENAFDENVLYLSWRNNYLNGDKIYKRLYPLAHYLAAATDSLKGYEDCIIQKKISDKCIPAKNLLIPEVFFRAKKNTETMNEFRLSCKKALKGQKVSGKSLKVMVSDKLECYGALPFEGKTSTIYLGTHFENIGFHSGGGLLGSASCYLYGFCPKKNIYLGIPWRGSIHADVAIAVINLPFYRKLTNFISIEIYKSASQSVNKDLSVSNKSLKNQTFARIARFQAKAANCNRIFIYQKTNRNLNKLQPDFDLNKSAIYLNHPDSYCNMYNLVKEPNSFVTEMCIQKKQLYTSEDMSPLGDGKRDTDRLLHLYFKRQFDEWQEVYSNGLEIFTSDGLVDSEVSCQAIAPYTYRKDGDYTDKSVKKRAWFKDGSSEISNFYLSYGSHGQGAQKIINTRVPNLGGKPLIIKHKSWWEKVLKSTN